MNQTSKEAISQFVNQASKIGRKLDGSTPIVTLYEWRRPDTPLAWRQFIGASDPTIRSAVISPIGTLTREHSHRPLRRLEDGTVREIRATPEEELRQIRNIGPKYALRIKMLFG